MIIRRWLHLSKQGVTIDLLFLLCSQWQGIHRKLCVCRCIDNNILRHWKRLFHEATATNNCPKQEESCDHSASSSCTLKTKKEESQFNAMLCFGFAMETLFGCFLLQSCLLLTSCRNAHFVNSMPCCAMDSQWKLCLVASYCRGQRQQAVTSCRNARAQPG